MSSDKRGRPRFTLESRVFIELVSPDHEGSDPGEIAQCQSVDVSSEGLQVRLERALSVGAILQIGVVLLPGDEALYLAAEVMWCRADPAHRNSWCAGLRILDATGSDIGDWRDTITGF
jgi:hypothetical protein